MIIISSARKAVKKQVGLVYNSGVPYTRMSLDTVRAISLAYRGQHASLMKAHVSKQIPRSLCLWQLMHSFSLAGRPAKIGQKLQELQAVLTFIKHIRISFQH